MPHSAKCIINVMETRTIFKNNLRTIEAQIVPKLKNEPRTKFTGFYNKKRVKNQSQRYRICFQGDPSMLTSSLVFNVSFYTHILVTKTSKAHLTENFKFVIDRKIVWFSLRLKYGLVFLCNGELLDASSVRKQTFSKIYSIEHKKSVYLV